MKIRVDIISDEEIFAKGMKLLLREALQPKYDSVVVIEHVYSKHASPDRKADVYFMDRFLSPRYVQDFLRKTARQKKHIILADPFFQSPTIGQIQSSVYILPLNTSTQFLSATLYKIMNSIALDKGLLPALSDTKEEKLTKREREVATLIVAGKRNREIAASLFISTQTVNVHRKNIMKKLNVHNVVNLLKVIQERGLSAL